MKKLSAWLGVFIVGAFGLWSLFRKNAAPENEVIRLPAAAASSSSSVVNRIELLREPSADRSNITANQPESVLEKIIPAKVLRQVEMKAIDSGPNFVRLGLYKDHIFLEGSDFYLEKTQGKDWGLISGDWLYGEIEFPQVLSPLHSDVAKALMTPKLPQNSQDISVEKIKEMWRVNADQVVQVEVWKVQYRAPTLGLRRENFAIDVAAQNILERQSSFRH